MKTLNYQTGKKGENLAREYLIKKGYRILQSNFHTRFGEIDLIATKDKLPRGKLARYSGTSPEKFVSRFARNKKLIFIEVKSKIGDQFGTPEEMINKRKLGKIQMMAEVFLQKNPQIAHQYLAYQIDAICLVLGPNNEVVRINHWEDLSSEMV